jgi:hypothetical protein
MLAKKNCPAHEGAGPGVEKFDRVLWGRGLTLTVAARFAGVNV